jgi:hypothetical protein
MTRFLGFFIILWLVMSLGILSKRANLVEQLQEKVSAMASTSLFGIFADWMDARAAGLVDYIVIWNPWQIAMIVGLLLSIWGLTQLKSSQVRQFTAAAGVAMQLSVSWWQWTTWSDRLNIDPEPVLGALLRSELGNTGRLSTEQGPWAENVFTPNTLMPAGVPVANGYDAIQPHGMKSPSGLPWEFPGVTHFLGKIINRAPNGWIEVWNDGEWRLLRRPEQSVGWIRMEHGEKPMLRDRFARPTLNTMEAEVPVGTAGLTLFSNWHRGWRWKEGATGAWKPAECSPIRSVQVVFDKPLVADSTIYFRFDPASPAWVMVVSGLSILGVAWTGMFMRMRMD